MYKNYTELSGQKKISIIVPTLPTNADTRLVWCLSCGRLDVSLFMHRKEEYDLPHDLQILDIYMAYPSTGASDDNDVDIVKAGCEN